MHCFLFDGLSKSELHSINTTLTDRFLYGKGEEVYKNGSLGIINNGSAVIRRKNSCGKTVNLRTIFQGDIFGSASLFGDWSDGSSSVIAQDSCMITYISEELWRKIITDYPTVAANYITYLTDRIRFLNHRIDAFSASDTEGRLYEYLLSICDSNGEVKLNYGMSELARRLNIGRSSLYRDIQSLESKRLIKRNGQNFKINYRG